MNHIEVKRMCQHLVEHGHPDMSSRYLTLRKFLAVADLDKCDRPHPDIKPESNAYVDTPPVFSNLLVWLVTSRR